MAAPTEGGLGSRVFGTGINRRRLGWLGLAAVLAVLAPWILELVVGFGLLDSAAFQLKILTTALIFAMLATAFNLLYGYTGLLSFGHAMFVAIAGYSVAKVVQVVAPALGIGEIFGGIAVFVTWLLAVAIGTLMATLLAIGIGYLSVRLEEIYFALITLSFSMAIWVIANQDIIGSLLEALGYGNGVFTNGSDGLTFTMGDVNLFGWEFTLVDIVNPIAYYFLMLIAFTLVMYILWRIVQSPFGATCKAIRENPERAEALGVNVTRHQWLTFIISGAFSGMAGAMLIPLLANVNPDQAYWTFSALPVLMTVIGGAYAFLGPLVGAFAYEYLRWAISQYAFLEAYWQFSFGILLLIVVLYFPNGVHGGLERLADWLRAAGRRTRNEGPAGLAAFLMETAVDVGTRLAAAGRSIGAAVRRLLSRLGV
ncbi:MAG: branched-chain amino acid ABC transporter permease [Salinirussus sp.]